jgi:hypothetical protein
VLCCVVLCYGRRKDDVYGESDALATRPRQGEIIPTWMGSGVVSIVWRGTQMDGERKGVSVTKRDGRRSVFRGRGGRGQLEVEGVE